MEWDHLRFFLAVARSGSLTGATQTLRTSPSTVARRVELLEQALGVTLFTHHQTGYQLTAEGQTIFHHAESVEEAVLSLERNATQQISNVGGLVRLATAENMANFFVIPALSQLTERYPQVTVEIVTGIHSINLTRRDADIALRMARPQRGKVVARKLAVLGYALYGSASYVQKRASARAGTVSAPSPDRNAYAADALIAFAEEYAHLPAAQWIDDALAGRRPALITSSLYNQVAAARAGLGLALLPCFLGDRDEALERVSPRIDEVTQDIWLVFHQDLRSAARVRVVADFLSDLVHNHAALLRG